MSTFVVAVEEIESILPHPKADRLEVAKLRGMTFQFVVAKGKHRSGDRVIYFPLDSIIPAPLLEALGLVGKLGGEGRNVISTVSLRGFYSQGVVEFPHVLVSKGLLAKRDYALGEDLANELGVTKYVKPDVFIPGAVLKDLPSVLSVYDIQGADRYVHVIDALMDRRCVFMEKLEGQNFGGHFESSPDVRRMAVLQRTNEIVETDGVHPFCEMARRERLAVRLGQIARLFPGEEVTFTGEAIGPGMEGNHYGLPSITARFFDIRRNGAFIDYEIAHGLFAQAGIQTAPILAMGITLREWLAGRTITEASHGPSAINPSKLREGVVVKPLTEDRDPEIGRLIIKQRDPIYLGKSGAR